MSDKPLSRFGRLIRESDEFLAENLDIPERYDVQGVRPAKSDRLTPYNLACAYKAMGMTMDMPRMYCMMYDRSRGPRYDIRSRDAAVRLCNVLSTVYGIHIEYRKLL